jgi:hypothetical protein
MPLTKVGVPRSRGHNAMNSEGDGRSARTRTRDPGKFTVAIRPDSSFFSTTLTITLTREQLYLASILRWHHGIPAVYAFLI